MGTRRPVDTRDLGSRERMRDGRRGLGAVFRVSRLFWDRFSERSLRESLEQQVLARG